MTANPFLLIATLLVAAAPALAQFPSPGHEPSMRPAGNFRASTKPNDAAPDSGLPTFSAPAANRSNPIAYTPAQPMTTSQTQNPHDGNAAGGNWERENRAAPAPTNQTPTSQTPLATRQTVFTIPFDIHVPSDPNQRPVEVQLHVSADQGANWQLYLRQAPGARSFEFRAPRDGEYWFTSRTIDAYRRQHPAGPLKPELRVLVDTTAPILELNAVVGEAGQVLTSWRVSDPQLVVDSFQISYQGSPSEPWQEVAVTGAATLQRVQQTMLENKITWWAESSSRDITIRAEVHDRAGNSTVVHRRLELPRIAAKPQLSDAVAGGVQPAPQSGIPWQSEGQSNVPLNHFDPSAPQSQLTGVNDPSGQLATEGHYPPQPQKVNPPFAGRFLVNDAPSTVSKRSIADLLPPGVQPRMTQASRFELDYDVQAIGPSGVAKVELFGTEDGGKTWKSWGLDDDNRSPLDIEVPKDGIYGFHIVITAGNGLASQPPKAGDNAEIWVGVDRAEPTARITSAIYGRGNQVGELDILWEVDDEKLQRAPITLLQSGTAGGPWTTIAENLPNNGRYSWQVDGRVPQQIYLRLEARDEAGNLAVHELAEPIANDGLVPRGTIRGLRPATAEQPASAFRWPWFR